MVWIVEASLANAIVEASLDHANAIAKGLVKVHDHAFVPFSRPFDLHEVGEPDGDRHHLNLCMTVLHTPVGTFLVNERTSASAMGSVLTSQLMDSELRGRSPV